MFGQTAMQPTRRRLPRGLAVLVAALLALALGGFAYDAATAPRPGPNGERFDPEVVGRLEQQAWEAYYRRRWLALFDVLLRLSRGAFNLSLPEAIYGSYLATQAQVVFARQGAQDGLAEENMRRFYDLVRDRAGGQYDSARAAELEIRWWVVHREHSQRPDQPALVAALADLYAETYGIPDQRARAAAQARADAMDLSDEWNRIGKPSGSPLLGRIADHLTTSYRVLHQAARDR